MFWPISENMNMCKVWWKLLQHLILTMPPPPLSVWTYASTTKYDNKHVQVGGDNFWNVTKDSKHRAFCRVQCRKRENGWIVSWNKTGRRTRQSFLKFNNVCVPWSWSCTTENRLITKLLLHFALNEISCRDCNIMEHLFGTNYDWHLQVCQSYSNGWLADMHVHVLYIYTL